ncbi:MAG TPA: hypothetical protein VGL75_10385 [Acidothermaceae bacterium]
MSSYDTPTKRRPLAARGARGPRLAVVAAGTVVASVTFLAGCTAAKSTATPPSGSVPASAAVSSGASAPASSAAASSGLSSPTPFASASALPSPVSSAVAGAPPVANIEAPATKTGFQIRVHRGSILKVDVPQAAAGTPITFTLVPASAQFITPIAGFNGYYNAASDGVVNVAVSQGGPSLGTLSVTVWG